MKFLCALLFLVISLEPGAFAQEQKIRDNSKDVTFRLIDNDGATSQVISIESTDDGFDVLDDTGFISVYLLTLALIKEQDHISNKIPFDESNAEKKLILEHLKRFEDYLSKKKELSATTKLVQKTLEDLKVLKSISGKDLYEKVMALNNNLKKEADIGLSVSIRPIGKTKWNEEKIWTDAGLPQLSDVSHLTYQK